MQIIIDTDMGADDWMATLLLLSAGEVEISALTITGNGLAHLGFGVQHALDLALLGEKPDIPVGIGNATPLAGSNTFPDMWRTPSDFFYGVRVPASPKAPSAIQAAELIEQTIRQSAGPVTILALAPMTNIATALTRFPDLQRKIERICIMGGAVNVAGNVAGSTSEYNFWTDYMAASIVLGAGVPITLVPLDATNQAPVTLEMYRRLAASSLTPAGRFVCQVLTAQLDSIGQGQYFFWDPLAAALLLKPSIGRSQPMRLAVKVNEGPPIDFGSLVPSESHESIDVITKVDAAAMEKFFIETFTSKLR